MLSCLYRFKENKTEIRALVSKSTDDEFWENKTLKQKFSDVMFYLLSNVVCVVGVPFEFIALTMYVSSWGPISRTFTADWYVWRKGWSYTGEKEQQVHTHTHTHTHSLTLTHTNTHIEGDVLLFTRQVWKGPSPRFLMSMGNETQDFKAGCFYEFRGVVNIISFPLSSQRLLSFVGHLSVLVTCYYYEGFCRPH